MLNSVCVYAQISISRGLAPYLKSKIKFKMRPLISITPEHLRLKDAYIETVSKWTGVSRDEIMGRRRDPNIVEARHLVMWALHRLSHLGTKEVGWLLQKDHSTITYAARNIDGYYDMPDWRRKSPDVNRVIRLCELLKQTRKEVQS